MASPQDDEQARGKAAVVEVHRSELYSPSGCQEPPRNESERISARAAQILRDLVEDRLRHRRERGHCLQQSAAPARDVNAQRLRERAADECDRVQCRCRASDWSAVSKLSASAQCGAPRSRRARAQSSAREARTSRVDREGRTATGAGLSEQARAEAIRRESSESEGSERRVARRWARAAVEERLTDGAHDRTERTANAAAPPPIGSGGKPSRRTCQKSRSQGTGVAKVEGGLVRGRRIDRRLLRGVGAQLDRASRSQRDSIALGWSGSLCDDIRTVFEKPPAVASVVDPAEVLPSYSALSDSGLKKARSEDLSQPRLR